MNQLAASESLPSISSARLPESYESAKTALAECSRIDECQSWADKAEALASYAKQAKDDTMRKYADRIQARAINRAGELLKLMSKGDGRPEKNRGADPTVFTRSEITQKTGMSRDQQIQAVRVATFAEENPDEYESLVESDSPPTVTALAERGKKNLVDLNGMDAGLYARATKVQGAVSRMAQMCRQNDPRAVAKGFKPHEISELQASVHAIDEWLDLFITNLGNDDEPH